MKGIVRRRGFIALLLPLIVWLLAFAVVPLIYGVYLSFQKAYISNIRSPEFIGLRNYFLLLSDSAFFRSILWSLAFSALSICLEFILGMSIAVLFNRRIPAKGVFLTVLLVPMVVSPALMGTMFRLLFNEFVGPLSYILGGITGTTALLGIGWVFQTVVLSDLVINTPYVFLNSYTALQGVPEEVIEASRIDGATAWQRFWRISSPIISPILGVTFLERALASFLIFDLVFTLTSGGPGTVTQSVSIYIYKRSFERTDFGMANAASTVVALLTFFPALLVVKKTLRRMRG